MRRAGLKSRIDWAAVHGRVEASQRALDEALRPTPQHTAEVYRRRAETLAQEGQAEAGSGGLAVLAFGLGEERYAVEIRHLSEAFRLGYCAPVPASPQHFLGVIGLRGEVRTVVDLRRLLAPASGASGGEGFVLMLRAGTGKEPLGLRVDRLEELREIRPEELRPPAPGSLVTALVSGPLALVNVDALLANVYLNQVSVSEDCSPR